MNGFLDEEREFFYDEEGITEDTMPVEEEETETKEKVSWLKRHKTGLIAVAAAAIGLVAGVVVRTLISSSDNDTSDTDWGDNSALPSGETNEDEDGSNDDNVDVI